jgi:hypothetical protein
VSAVENPDLGGGGPSRVDAVGDAGQDLDRRLVGAHPHPDRLAEVRQHVVPVVVDRRHLPQVARERRADEYGELAPPTGHERQRLRGRLLRHLLGRAEPQATRSVGVGTERVVRQQLGVSHQHHGLERAERDGRRDRGVADGALEEPVRALRVVAAPAHRPQGVAFLGVEHVRRREVDVPLSSVCSIVPPPKPANWT